MIHLYAAPTSNGLRAKIMLEECGLPYVLHAVDLAQGEHRTPAFRAMNPMQMIPVLVDEDGPGGKRLTLAQSVAILLYLAEKCGRFLPTDPARRPAFFEAVMNASTDVGPALAGKLAIARSATPHATSEQIFESRLRTYFSVWNARLADQPFCAGDEITIADFVLYSVHIRCEQLYPELVDGNPALQRWAATIGARPGVKRGVAF
jgi:GST-like protein